MMLESHARELQESEHERFLATWNIIVAAITLAALIFGLDDKIGIGAGVAVILLLNVGALVDRTQRLRAAVERDKAAADAQKSN